MLNKNDIQETSFKFRCEPVDRKTFKQIFEQQSVITADFCHDLFYRTYQEWKAQGVPTKKTKLYEFFHSVLRELRKQYNAHLPAAVLEACVSRVEAQFANPQKRDKFIQRLELPRFSASSIPIRSDRGIRFSLLPIERPGELLNVRLALSLLPQKTKDSSATEQAVHIRLKDKSLAAVMQRIINGYEIRKWLKNEQKKYKDLYNEKPPTVSKELLCSEESYPPSSSGAVIYDREKDCFYLSIGYSRPKERIRNLDPTRVMAIDVGISSPFTLAFNFKKQPIVTEELGKMLRDVRSEFYKRRRVLQAKFAAAPRKVYRQRLRKLSEAWDGKLRQLMGNTCAYIRQLVEKYQIGRVKIDRPSGREPTFFTVQCRGEKFRVPVIGMLDMLERNLREMLGDKNVESTSFLYSSQICSECGHWNDQFTWGYRREHGWPDFSCPKCGITLDADVNAAKTMLREDYAEIRNRIRRRENDEDENILDNQADIG